MTARDEREERWHLLDRQAFLHRSLEDAAEEHGAGDLGEEDFARLGRRDRVALAHIDARLIELDLQIATNIGHSNRESDQSNQSDATSVGEKGTTPIRRRRLGFLLAGVLAMGMAVTVLVATSSSPRLPGDEETGGLSLGGPAAISRLLGQATTLVSEGKAPTALLLYRQVLLADPKNPTAMASVGWIEWNVGTRSHNEPTKNAGRAEEERAVASTPGSFVAHFYLGSIELAVREVPEALGEFNAFLADRPPEAWLEGTAATIRGAFTDAGQPVPAGVPAASPNGLN